MCGPSRMNASMRPSGERAGETGLISEFAAFLLFAKERRAGQDSVRFSANRSRFAPRNFLFEHLFYVVRQAPVFCFRERNELGLQRLVYLERYGRVLHSRMVNPQVAIRKLKS